MPYSFTYLTPPLVTSLGLAFSFPPSPHSECVRLTLIKVVFGRRRGTSLARRVVFETNCPDITLIRYLLFFRYLFIFVRI